MPELSQLKHIAHIRSDFAGKFGIHRQSGLVEELRATIVFDPEFRNPDALPSDFQTIRVEEGVERAVCDYVSGMTDNFAVETYSALFIPKAWTVK